jgi:hypothetical protein
MGIDLAGLSMNWWSAWAAFGFSRMYVCWGVFVPLIVVCRGDVGGRTGNGGKEFTYHPFDKFRAGSPPSSMGHP